MRSEKHRTSWKRCASKVFKVAGGPKCPARTGTTSAGRHSNSLRGVNLERRPDGPCAETRGVKTRPHSTVALACRERQRRSGREIFPGSGQFVELALHSTGERHSVFRACPRTSRHASISCLRWV